MGAYQKLYFGPFLEIPKIKGTHTEGFKRCDNTECKCKKKLSVKFCPECGVKTTKHTQTHEVLVSAFPEELDYDILYPPHAGGAEISNKIDWLLPSETKGTPFEKYVKNIDGDNCGPIEVSEDAEIAISLFAEYHKDIIAEIKDFGGEPKVKYGLFIHYS